MRRMLSFRVLSTVPGGSHSRGIQTGTVFSARERSRKIPRIINYEPGLRHREAVLSEGDSSCLREIQNEDDLEPDIDILNVDKAYDMDKLDKKLQKERLGRIITIKKFFRNPPQPLTLTCNERDCIRFLHKSDPVQWDIKTLSESFPATPETIKKVLKKKLRFNTEERKKLDFKVQKNWELLAEGKLRAAPEVLEHLKKFINRREVLLEQIKSADFYLPEVKKEVVWNNGEMSNILVHYEKAVEKLTQKQDSENVELLCSGSEKSNSKTEKKSLDVVHEKINEFMSTRNLEGKESFTLGGMVKAYSKPVTLEELKKKLLARADERKPLHLTEKAIMDSVLGISNEENISNAVNSESSAFKRKAGNLRQNIQEGSFQEKAIFGPKRNQRNKLNNKEELEKLKINDEKKEFVLPDSKTKFFISHELGNALNEITNKDKGQPSQEKNSEKMPEIEVAVEKNLNFSNLKSSEKHFYDSQVKDIENTEFWNAGRTSQEKALAENKKGSLGGPDLYARGHVYADDVYPERIQIPKNKRGSGLTFRVKDCYYDDDGEFLYRVPGMVK